MVRHVDGAGVPPNEASPTPPGDRARAFPNRLDPEPGSGGLPSSSCENHIVLIKTCGRHRFGTWTHIPKHDPNNISTHLRVSRGEVQRGPFSTPTGGGFQVPKTSTSFVTSHHVLRRIPDTSMGLAYTYSAQVLWRVCLGQQSELAVPDSSCLGLVLRCGGPREPSRRS